VTVIDDAEKQAQQHLERARIEADQIVSDRVASMVDLTDSLVAQAAAIRDQSKQLLASLAEAKRRIAAEGGGEIAAVEAPVEPLRAPHLSAVDPVAEPAAPTLTELRTGGGEGSAAGARLLATQMAVSGSSREEIDARLRNGFEIEDTASILDAILGPED
jgi:hypothetical protein